MILIIYDIQNLIISLSTRKELKSKLNPKIEAKNH